MGRNKKEDNAGGAQKRYWAVPKVPVGLRLDKDLVERAKEAARVKKIPFTALIASGIERELYAISKGN
jgi:hypothetical protein